MKKNTASFGDALAALTASAVPAVRALRGLSNIEGDQLKELQSAWRQLYPGRRVYVAEKLREMALEDVELDFNSIFEYTLGDSEERVRLSSVEGLWEDERARLIDPLAQLLRGDPSEIVRAAAATALGQFLYLGEMEKITRHRRDQAYSVLMGAILTTTPESLVYQRALESLAYAVNPQVDELIRESFASDNPALRRSAVLAMGRSGDRHFGPLVVEELHSVSPAMRAEAARACGELEVATAVPGLGKLIDDSDIDVVISAIEALAEIGGDEARQILDQAAKSKNEEIAGAAREALEQLDFLHGDIKFSTSWIDELLNETRNEPNDSPIE